MVENHVKVLGPELLDRGGRSGKGEGAWKGGGGGGPKKKK
jgi:hypothetical protein